MSFDTQRYVKALFIWADGYRDYRKVTARAPFWHRYRLDRNDLDKEKLQNFRKKLFSVNAADQLQDIEIIRFARVNFQNGSFCYKEVVE